MKNNLKKIITKALKKSFEKEIDERVIEIQKTTTKHVGSDYFTNIAMKLAKQLKINPMELAEKILSKIEKSDMCECSVAKPGYINFIIQNAKKNNIVKEILGSNDLLKSCKTDKSKKINVEFISANPTGPLHVGHGRGAIYGNIIAKFLKIQGHNVTKEYYVNDHGNQIEKLMISIHAKINSKYGEGQKDLYQGKYIERLASKFKTNNSVNKRKVIKSVISLIETPLVNLNIKFDNWFYETSLFDDGLVNKLINKLEESGHTIKKEGALMLKADEPRVLIKSNKEYTYFASDLAYHNLKMKEYDMVINVWGADHHGYVPRMITGLKALGHNIDKLDIHLMQFANLFRGKEKISMSTRKGEFVELETLREEIGNDAMNFFYLTKNKDQHLDFDLNLAITENKNNPVYYIQYAHARIEKILNDVKDYKSYGYNLESLDNELEKNIISTLLNFNDVCEKTIINLQPHMMTHYLQKLAQDFHSYYANVKILTDEINYSRIYMIAAVQKVLKCGLELLNISAPKEM